MTHNRPAHTAAVKLLIDGTQAASFLADMLPPPQPPGALGEISQIAATSRERDCRPRESVELYISASIAV